MKQKIKSLISFFNYIMLLLHLKKSQIKGSSFFKTTIRFQRSTNIGIFCSRIENTSLTVSGSDNKVAFHNAYVAGSVISIEGSQNQVNFEKGVMFRDSSLIIRGENCVVNIGANTTFGGIRIVNAGKNNNISIGSNCLFSDYIELWASDTHPIFNESGQIINQEKPIFIGDHVWVGSKVTILKGVTIQSGSIIGMGSVVTKDVPSNVISAGYPNKTIKENVSWKLEY
ncbi:acyltransferase [Mucilaginibacter lappiensis]|jgi:acetyltransferase-like isoleucine patch superfamily enzyme|uniref:acyltransferase n=1 Tax=Mucilaginibacter lappiensis TaxID=354630 RepID=UPI003D1DA82F